MEETKKQAKQETSLPPVETVNEEEEAAVETELETLEAIVERKSSKSSTKSENESRTRSRNMAEEEEKDKLPELDNNYTRPRRIKIIHVDKEEPSTNSGTMKPIKTFDARRISRDEGFQQRVNRFLSVWDIPPEEITFTMNSYEIAKKKGDYSSETKEKSERAASPPVKRKFSMLSQTDKSRIIKDIIKNYDQERFLDKFRTLSVVEVKLEKNKPEVTRQRDRLLKLMKSDTIRLNDINYMNELSEKLQDNLRTKQEKKIEELAEQEKRRERRLVLKGLTDEENEEDLEPIRNNLSRKSSRKSQPFM